jgi:hypothetical protein
MSFIAARFGGLAPIGAFRMRALNRSYDGCLNGLPNSCW